MAFRSEQYEATIHCRFSLLSSARIECRINTNTPRTWASGAHYCIGWPIDLGFGIELFPEPQMVVEDTALPLPLWPRITHQLTHQGRLVPGNIVISLMQIRTSWI